MRQLIMMAVVAAGFALVASPAFAQSVGSLMNRGLAQDQPGVEGDNLLSIPLRSPLNNNPTNAANNGFQQICRRCALTGTASQVIQFDAQLGNITTFQCNQAAAPPWTPGQAALVRPTIATSCRIPGVESSAPYTSWLDTPGAKGDNLFPTPLTATAADPQTLCVQLNLPATSEVIRFKADPPAAIQSHQCGQVPVFNLVLGEGVLIRPKADATGTALIY